MKKFLICAFSFVATTATLSVAELFIPSGSRSTSGSGSAPAGAAYLPSNQTFTGQNVFTNELANTNNSQRTVDVWGSFRVQNLNDPPFRQTSMTVVAQYGGVDGLAVLCDGGLPFVVKNGSSGLEYFRVNLNGDTYATNGAFRAGAIYGEFFPSAGVSRTNAVHIDAGSGNHTTQTWIFINGIRVQ